MKTISKYECVLVKVLFLLVVAIAFVPKNALAVAFTTLHNTHTTYGTSVASSQWADNYVQYSTGIFAYDVANEDKDWAYDTTKLAWNIVYDPNTGLYTYNYWWSTNKKDLSHIIIELTNGVTGITVPDASQTAIDTYTSSSNGGSNPGLPGSIYGIKVSPGSKTTSYQFSFTTINAPVWGNFYAKDGNDGPVYAYNTGLANAETGVFIARPDGNAAPVPEPATIFLIGIGLIGLAVTGLTRQSKD